MLKPDEIKQLADGRKPGQDVTVIVEARAVIIPAVVLNVYLNLAMQFISMNAAYKPLHPNLKLDHKGGMQDMVNIFMFKTKRENFEKYFGPYHPGKILKFEPGKKSN